MSDFPKTLEALLVAEHNEMPEEAARLVKKHTNIVLNAILSGTSFINIRAAAMAIELAESDERAAAQQPPETAT